MQRKLLNPEKRYILRFEEKHGDRYFVILGEKELHQACLKVLKERFQDRNWYYNPPSDEPEIPAYTQEQILQLQGAAREAAQREFNNYKKELRDHQKDMEQWARIKIAVETGDGAAAFQILQDRSDYEYERMVLEASESLVV